MTEDNAHFPGERVESEIPAERFQPAIEPVSQANFKAGQPPVRRRLRRVHAIWALILLVTFLLGLGSGYGFWGTKKPDEKASRVQNIDMEKIMAQVNPPKGYAVPARFGDMGPKMAAAGVFDMAEFEQVYQQSNQPLNAQQLDILRKGSDAPVVFNQQNAYFLLNYFWAVGLSNQNPILDKGPIKEYSKGKIENFASTGGWSLAKKKLSEIYSKLSLIALTVEQQKHLEEAAKAVYRPCCDKPTDFPDCNHGMAMLGLMELMASQGATVEQMLAAGRYANAYWYPSQTVEQAIYLKITTGKDYQDVDARQLLGRQTSSGSGFQAINQYLVQNHLLPDSLKNSGGCGV